MTWSHYGTQILNNKTMKHTFTYFDYERRTIPVIPVIIQLLYIMIFKCAKNDTPFSCFSSA